METPCSITNKHHKFLALGIAHTAQILWCKKTKQLRQGILNLLLQNEPLSPEDQTIIQSCLDSEPGKNLLDKINKAIGIVRTQYENVFLQTAQRDLMRFHESKWENRYQELAKLWVKITEFITKNDGNNPRLTISDVKTHIQNRQYLATRWEQRRVFTEACNSGIAETLSSVDNSVQLCHVPHENTRDNLIGAWNGREILGEVIPWVKPVEKFKPFFCDYPTILCFNANADLCLIEFHPYDWFTKTPESMSLIVPKRIGDRGTLQKIEGNGREKMWYGIIDKSRVIHSGPGGTIINNQAIQSKHVGNDILFITRESSEKGAHTIIRSLQTGGDLKIPDNNIAKTEETEGNIVFHLRNKSVFSGDILNAKWHIGRELWWTQSISLKQLQELWEKAYKRAKNTK
jgi:hypothetical protein